VRFTKPFWPGIADGSITVAYRWWTAPTVVAGRPYRTAGGRVEVVSVDVVDPAGITDDDAATAGHPSADDVRAWLQKVRQRGSAAGGQVYRVEFRRLDEPDPRQVLANTADLSPEDLADLDRRLDRLDRASKIGPWTRQTLQLIAERPATRAPDLAESVGRETPPFKLDVRKLKNLGLTISLNPGYRLSPRGRAYLDASSGGSPPAAG
jgi:hypothetical protein